MKSSFIILFCVLCGLFVPCHAQSVPDSIQKDFYSLYFGHDKTTIDENYLENGKQLERLRSMLSTSVIDSIAIYAYSSPEGTQAHNMQLSLHRAEAVRDFILSNLPSNTTLDANDIHLFPAGENWKGLTKELETNYHLLNRDRVLKIMYADVPGDTKKWRLRNLDNGFTYSWIIQHHMPLLRVATLVGIYTSEPAEAKPDTIPALEPDWANSTYASRHVRTSSNVPTLPLSQPTALLWAHNPRRVTSSSNLPTHPSSAAQKMQLLKNGQRMTPTSG